jgi:hypothetical protein
MKVLFLTPWYPHRYDAMSGLFVRKHAQAVARQGVEVTVLSQCLVDEPLLNEEQFSIFNFQFSIFIFPLRVWSGHLRSVCR